MSCLSRAASATRAYKQFIRKTRIISPCFFPIFLFPLRVTFVVSIFNLFFQCCLRLEKKSSSRALPRRNKSANIRWASLESNWTTKDVWPDVIARRAERLGGNHHQVHTEKTSRVERPPISGWRATGKGLYTRCTSCIYLFLMLLFRVNWHRWRVLRRLK